MSNKVQVTVINGVPSVDIDKLKPSGKGVTLEWKLKNSNGWSFASNGIAIDNNTGQFTSPTRKDNGNTFTWDDANSDGKTYKYTVWVQQGSNPAISLDPQIENQGPGF